MNNTGPLDMLASQYDAQTAQVSYTLRYGDTELAVSRLLGERMTLQFLGEIFCVVCAKSLKKAYGQGFCYPCFRDSALASPCIIFPEKCEGHLGRGRDPDWENRHHVQPHVVYLSDTGAIKVGVTRQTQCPKRWIDQGATAAAVIAHVPYRALAGDLEVKLKAHFTDKTQWRTMLTYTGEADLASAAREIQPLLGGVGVTESLWRFVYPIQAIPQTITALSLEKTPEMTDVLVGVKGQYLLFEKIGVLNVRNHMGYHVRIDGSGDGSPQKKSNA